MKHFLIIFMALVFVPMASTAQDLSGLARVVMNGSEATDNADETVIQLNFTQPVPYRLFTLDAPKRLVLDFNEADWSGFNADAFDKSARIAEVHTGIFRAGWSRIVILLDAPVAVKSAELNTETPDGRAQLQLVLASVNEQDFAASAGAPPDAQALRDAAVTDLPEPIRRQTGDEPLVVVLDPGHGGIDPGAEHDGVIEADLMLRFAKELEEAMLRAGNFKVVLTRQDDSFVPLESRVSIARQAGADAFLSLHADALVEGRASGATIYTLSESASDIASQRLAERHDRADLLAGLDLSDQDDVVAGVLLDLARTETAPRSDKLADALVTGLSQAVGVHKRPKLAASFSVLKAADIPSVLIELGFLSSPRDRKNLRDKKWRADAAQGVLNALRVWAKEDAAEARLLRK